jgi:hypothetical protein
MHVKNRYVLDAWFQIITFSNSRGVGQRSFSTDSGNRVLTSTVAR